MQEASQRNASWCCLGPNQSKMIARLMKKSPLSHASRTQEDKKKESSTSNPPQTLGILKPKICQGNPRAQRRHKTKAKGKHNRNHKTNKLNQTISFEINMETRKKDEEMLKTRKPDQQDTTYPVDQGEEEWKIDGGQQVLKNYDIITVDWQEPKRNRKITTTTRLLLEKKKKVTNGKRTKHPVLRCRGGGGEEEMQSCYLCPPGESGSVLDGCPGCYRLSKSFICSFPY